jgi:hypothetical protein
MLKLLDFFFIVFHSLLIIFNLFGWIFSKTRLLNLVTLTLTGFSWFFLGIFYGFGYCPFTDWHFRVLEKTGVSGLPDSYIKYLADRLLKTEIGSGYVDLVTVLFYLAALIFSLVFNIIAWRKAAKEKK